VRFARRTGRQQALEQVMAEAIRHRAAVCLSKDGDARFMGHLDFARLIERSLRRSGLPVQCTQGFNPRFRLAFSDALPVGVASEGEWISLTLDEDLPPDTIRARLMPALPECVRVVAVRTGDLPSAPASVRYRLDVTGDIGSATDALTALLRCDSFLVDDARRSVPFDVRPCVAGGEARDGCLLLELIAVNHRPPRPGFVVAALRALALQAGLPDPAFGACTKLCEIERRQGEVKWDDVAEAARTGPQDASCSSMPARARRAG
jgi:radical SAM-linked protein